MGEYLMLLICYILNPLLSTFLSIYTKYISTNHNKSPELKRMIDRISLQRYEFCEKTDKYYVGKTTEVDVDKWVEWTGEPADAGQGNRLLAGKTE